MTLDNSHVLGALRAVDDPLIGSSIVDLGIVQDVSVDGENVAIRLAIPVPRDTLAEALVTRVRDALHGAGIEHGNLEVVGMSDEEVEQLSERLRPTDERANNPFASADNRTRILGISSGKGGVGKSSVTVNLAVTLARRGHDVAVIDADVYGFSIPKMLGAQEDPALLGKLVIPPTANGVRCISIGYFVEEEEPVMWRGPMLHKALEQFLTDIYWGEPDYLLVDMPPGTGDIALSMAQYLQRSEVLVVTTPQEAAQRVAQRSAFMAQKVNLSLAGVIENMSWFTGDDGKRYELFGSGGGAALAEKLSVPLLGQVPLVPQLREGGDSGQPIVVSDPKGEVANAFASIAEKLEQLAPRRIYSSALKVSQA